MNDLISIIVPIYNSNKYLEECISSIISQTYKNLEIILINDGSRDNSLDICNKLKQKDKRIIVINKENTGVSDTRNIGIKISKGKYIVFVDSDDIIDKKMIEILYKEAINNNADVVRCNYTVYNSKKVGKLYDLENKKFVKDEIKNIIPYFITNNKNIPSYVWTLLINKDKIVDFDRTLYFMEDTDFFIRLLLNINAIYISNKYLYYYRYNDKSVSRDSKKVISNILGILDAEKKIKETLNKKSLLNSNLEKKMNATIFTIILSKLKLILNEKINTEKIIKLLNEKEIVTTLNNTNLQEIPFKIIMEYITLKNKWYNLFFLILKLKKVLKNGKL